MILNLALKCVLHALFNATVSKNCESTGKRVGMVTTLIMFLFHDDMVPYFIRNLLEVQLLSDEYN